ncbi:MAG: hypothetical protein HZA17_10480, partial [Nitrospirae bacterium]|nr:hypothetical protein [Nitrospirota bacterium]
EEYKSYKQYVSRSGVYIVVHPGYYAFFDNKTALSPANNTVGGFPEKNIVERLSLEISPNDFNLNVMQEQEALFRDFLEFMSMEKKLVILIVPRDYKKHMTREYIPGKDEYARYINDLTNLSESIIYLESLEPNTGFMSREDMEILKAFLHDAEIKSVLYSGGYVGRCLDNFNTSLTDTISYESVYFVPEMASVAPDEINEASHRYLLTKDGKINFKGVIKYFKSYGFERVKVPKIKRFSLFKFSRIRDKKS